MVGGREALWTLGECDTQCVSGLLLFDEDTRYTTVGSLIREVCLSDGSQPLHAIQLPSGQLLVSHDGTLHRIIVVGLDGQVIRSYGNTKGSQAGQFSDPGGMALFSKQGCVGLLVADYSNNR